LFLLKVGESWHEEPESMVYQKRYAESIVFNGEMLVMGGYNQNIGWLNAVEKRHSTYIRIVSFFYIVVYFFPYWLV
jgi:hypothetical protein